MKAAVAGALAGDYQNAIVDRMKAEGYRYQVRAADGPPRARVRLLLRRRPGGRLRVPGTEAVRASPGLPDRRDHPQPAREREAARVGHSLPQRSRRERGPAHDRRRRDPARLRRHREGPRTLRGDRLHAGGHDVRVGAQRLEERRALRPGRLHVGHPRQDAPRGDARHGVAGADPARREVPGGVRPGRGRDGVRLHPPRRGPRRLPVASSARPPPTGSTPTATSPASAWRTRRRC